MLNPTFVASLAQSIAEVILAPAIRHTEDVTYIHVLQDALQKIRQPRYHRHPDFAPGYTFGQLHAAAHHERPGAFTLEEVIAVLCDNLARHDHDELCAFYQAMGWEICDYASRVGFALGWLTAVIEDGKAPVSPLRSQRSPDAGNGGWMVASTMDACLAQVGTIA
jgi:hypothetical protein